MKDKKELIMTAMGKTDADLLLKGGYVVDVFTGKVKRSDVLIKNGYICGIGEYSCENSIDISGKYVMPGFIDSHLHIESSMVTPHEYAAITLPHGVTTIIADPHEIANVCGRDGLKFMKEDAKNVPMDINFMLPSCVPSTGFEHAGAELTSADIRELYPEFFGIAEMMNYPGVCGGDEETIARLIGEKIDGHAPLLSGHELDAYVSAGIKTDHECSNVEEMREKIAKGMYIALREGTLSKDLFNLIGGMDPYTLRRCMFCTDDRFIGEIMESGSIDNCIRKAIALGIKPIDAIITATLNAAECYGMKDKGAVAPSYVADLVVADSIQLGNIEMVLKQGKIVAKNGKPLFDTEAETDASAVSESVHLAAVTAKDFAYTPKNERFTAIELIPDMIITKKVTSTLADDPAKVCVLERHHMLGTKGFGFVTNYGIENGAIASSVGHDSHNITVIGDNDEDMALAVNTLGTKGGIAVCSKGEVLGYLPLDIAGLMSTEGAEEVAKLHGELEKSAHALGVDEHIDPFLSLAFIPLPVIPEIRVTDMGLFDVTKFEFTE
jgi:adenine deaminase